MLLTSMTEHFANLGLTAAAVDPGHEFRKLFASGNPARSAAFVQPTKINQLDVESADACRLAKHVGLKPASRVPSRLPTHCCIKRENQTCADAPGIRRPQCPHPFKKRLDLRLGGNRCRRLLGVLGHRTEFYTESGPLARLSRHGVRWWA